MRRKLAAGNWKMNGTRAALAELDRIGAGAGGESDILICPPFPLLAEAAARVSGTAVTIGAQDCHFEPSGAHTGDVSAGMILNDGDTA